MHRWARSSPRWTQATGLGGSRGTESSQPSLVESSGRGEAERSFFWTSEKKKISLDWLNLDLPFLTSLFSLLSEMMCPF